VCKQFLDKLYVDAGGFIVLAIVPLSCKLLSFPGGFPFIFNHFLFICILIFTILILWNCCFFLLLFWVFLFFIERFPRICALANSENLFYISHDSRYLHILSSTILEFFYFSLFAHFLFMYAKFLAVSLFWEIEASFCPFFQKSSWSFIAHY